MVPEPPIAPSSATSGLGLGCMIPLELPFRQHSLHVDETN